MYKMVDISTEVWNKADISVIQVHENDNVNKKVALLCISDASKRWGGKNLFNLTGKEIKGKYTVETKQKQKISKYKIDTARLFKGSKHSIYGHEYILITIIMQSRLSDPKTIKFRDDFFKFR